ncbi:MAG: ABC transporter permease [Chloroflexota bacterium]|nr:ABC transporter permease [Chloroflexota bacterium]
MARYAVLRLLQGIIVIWIVTLMVFTILHLTPGDPVDLIVGEANMTTQQRDQIRHFWGLDKPIYVQYFTWLKNIVHGDFGESVTFGGRPVSDLLRAAAPNTLKLNALALIISILVAIPVGVFAAVKQYSFFDGASIFLSTLGISIPNFWLGLMLIILFSLKLGWLPPFGSNGWKAYILPVFVLSSEQMALFARLTRATTLEVMNQEYVATARAKGLAERIVLFRHIVRNALLPIITVVGFRIGVLLSGTIVIETVFAWPGIGRLLFQAISRRDYLVVQSIVTIGAAIVVVATLLTDLIYAYVDPRIRYR